MNELDKYYMRQHITILLVINSRDIIRYLREEAFYQTTISFLEEANRSKGLKHTVMEGTGSLFKEV